MKELLGADLFCGGGGTSTGLAQACADKNKRLKLIAVNHWDIAIETHSANHPEAKHICESMDNVDPRKVVPGGRLNILVASPECFPAETMILTDKGLVPIQDISVGMRVLTHKNRYRVVTDVMKTVKDTIRVKGHGHFGLETTAAHPIYTRKRHMVWQKSPANPNRRVRWSYSEPVWNNASESVGSMWAIPTRFPDLLVPPLDGFEFSEAFWWFIGRWLGDGSVQLRPGKGGEISIACGDHEADALESRLQSRIPYMRWTRRRTRTATLLEFRNTELAAWLIRYFGKKASGKTIPAFVLAMEDSWRIALLGGYLSADGHFNGRKLECTTVSKRLGVGIRLLAESLGHRTAFHFAKARNNPIEGRTVHCLDQYRVMWVRSRQKEESKEIDGHAWSKVKGIELGRKDVAVYNLSVDEDESYVADGIVVHNCTHHSRARGGKPINDQSRASAFHILRWAEALYIDNILIENVPEFQSWGPCGVNGRPLKSKCGQTFKAFIDGLKSLGYTVDWRVLNAADYGDATTRRRLFIMARRGGKKIVWPMPTHTPDGTANLFGATERWRPAKEIIDWSIQGKSIFKRKKPLAPATMARIMAGLEKFGSKEMKPFIVALRNHTTARSIDQPLHTITAGGNHFGIATPFVLGQQSGSVARSVDLPIPTIAGAGAIALVEPHLVEFHGGKDAAKRTKSLEDPMPTIDCGNRFGLSESFLIPFFGEREGQEPRVHSVDKPLPAVTSHGAGGLVESFLVPVNHGAGDKRSHSVEKPVPTITAFDAMGLAEAFVMPIDQQGSEGPNVRSVDQPLATVTTKERFAVVEPYLVKFNQGRLVQPFLQAYYGNGSNVSSTEEPMPTATARDRFALVEPDVKQAPEGYQLDIRFRMLHPKELAAAMSFPDGYEFAGNREEKVKQIGNAVCVRTARALCNSLIG